MVRPTSLPRISTDTSRDGRCGRTAMAGSTAWASSSGDTPRQPRWRILALAALGLALIGARVSLVRARQEQNQTEAAFGVAQAAVDDLFVRIADEHEFDLPGLQPLRAVLLERALHYYEDILHQYGNDPLRDSLAAGAQSRIAQITRVIGSPGEAVWQFKNAVARQEALVQHHPGNSQYEDDLIHILTDLGEVLLAGEGKREEALRLFKRAGQWIEPRNGKQPIPQSRRRALIRVLGDIAQIERETGQAEQARESLEARPRARLHDGRGENVHAGRSDRPGIDPGCTGTIAHDAPRNA